MATQSATRWIENIDVFITPNVPLSITYCPQPDTPVTTTVIFRDLLDIDGVTYLIMANGTMLPLNELIAVYPADTARASAPRPSEDASFFSVKH